MWRGLAVVVLAPGFMDLLLDYGGGVGVCVVAVICLFLAVLGLICLFV